MTGVFLGQVALITGASRGIGAATARELASGGAAVGLLARSTEAIEQLADEIRDGGGRALAVPCEIANAIDVRAATDTVARALGPIDILINNAGMVHPIAPIHELSPADFDLTVSVNLNGAFYAAQAALGHMKERGSGTIVNVSSGAADRPLEGWTSYCVSKAGLAMLTQALALEAAGYARVFGFKPGTVDTEMQGVIRESGLNPISRMTRDQHRPPEIPAKVIGYLCTERADDLVGREISIAEPGLLARIGLE